MRPTTGSEPAGERWIWLVPALALLVASVFMFADPRPLKILRNATFDQYQRWLPRTPADGTVAIVDIDEESLRRLGQWPWPRTRLAELITDLQDLQTTAVALDIALAEPDRTSPRALLQDGQVPEALARGLAALPDHDDLLAAVLGKSNAAIGLLATYVPLSAGLAAGATPSIAAKAGIATIGGSPLGHLSSFAEGSPNLPVLREAAPERACWSSCPTPTASSDGYR